MNLKYSLIAAACCLLCMASCKKEDDEYRRGGDDGPAISSLIRFTEITPGVLPADTVSTAKITIAIDAQADSASRYVTFHTTGGLFGNEDTVQTVQVNAYGIGTVLMHGHTAGRAMVRAEVRGIAIDTAIILSPARPQDMQLVADKYTGDTTDSFTVTASLFRAIDKGKVSDPSRVYFSVISNDTSANKLIIPRFADSEAGKASITIRNPFGTKGKYTIQAVTAFDNTSDSIRREIAIVIQ